MSAYVSVIVLVLGAIAAQLLLIPTWAEVLTTKFIASTLLTVIAALRAMYIEKPGGRDAWTDLQRLQYRADHLNDTPKSG